MNDRSADGDTLTVLTDGSFVDTLKLKKGNYSFSDGKNYTNL